MRVLTTILMILVVMSGFIVPDILRAEENTFAEESKLEMEIRLEDADGTASDAIMEIRIMSNAGSDTSDVIIEALREAGVDIQLENADDITSEAIKEIRMMSNAGSYINDIIFEALRESGVDIQLDGSTTIIQMNRTVTNRSDIPFLGIHSQNLTIPKMNELGYTETGYGVLITGTVPNSPARLHRILRDDILMSIEDINISDTDQITNAIARFYIGDTVSLKIFRDGEVINIDVELGDRNAGTSTTKTEHTTKKKNSVGYGGGSWYPIWFYEFDVSDINDRLSKLGFGELQDDGLIFQGGGGKGHVGKGFFLGGMGAGYGVTRRQNTVFFTEDEIAVPVQRRYNYSTYFWGISLDKRFAISSRFLVSPGFMIGSAGHNLALSQIGSNYSWDDFEAYLSSGHNISDRLSKGYFIVQPRFEVLCMLLDWLGLRAEAGYLYGYSPYNGWKNTAVNGEVFDVLKSPNTPFEGWTFSVGPWFGF